MSDDMLGLSFSSLEVIVDNLGLHMGDGPPVIKKKIPSHNIPICITFIPGHLTKSDFVFSLARSVLYGKGTAQTQSIAHAILDIHWET